LICTESDLVDELNIVTLNHDTLVEQVLAANGIEFSDGFGRPDGDVRWFEGSFASGCKVRLIKPHGSISWWRQGSGKVIQPADIADRNSQSWRDGQGQLLKGVGATPSFLTGVSKVFSYNQGAFADHNYMLLSLLQRERLMVMSGYGWGDIPINFQLQNWFDRSRENRMVLLHRKPDELRDGSLELMQIYDGYTTQGRIVPIEKWLGDACMGDLRQFL
jgi:hypothetical protein